jgi:hypothetical protein
MMKKRSLFDELMEGVSAMKDHRESPLDLRAQQVAENGPRQSTKVVEDAPTPRETTLPDPRP